MPALEKTLILGVRVGDREGYGVALCLAAVQVDVLLFSRRASSPLVSFLRVFAASLECRGSSGWYVGYVSYRSCTSLQGSTVVLLRYGKE